MPRKTRIAIPEVPYHITQRGNNRQNVFFVDDDRQVCYVEQNPVRSGMARQAWKYEWSSAEAHLTGDDPTELLNISYWKEISRQVDWRQALLKIQPEEIIRQIRQNTHTGRPLAGDSFISKLEKFLNKRLRPLPVGRPKKSKKEDK